MKLYRPSPATGSLHVSSDALGDMRATVLPGGAVLLSPPQSVLTRGQVRAIVKASDASQAIRRREAMPPNVELVEDMPLEDQIALSDDDVEAV